MRNVCNMNRTPKLALAASALVIAALSLAGCYGLDGKPLGGAPSEVATATPSPTATASSREEVLAAKAERAAAEKAKYEAAQAKYELPDGYEWPAYGDPSQHPGTDDFAQLIWACIRLDAAWAAIDAGDPAEADALVAPVYRTPIWASDPPTFGTSEVAREWGWHGICTQQLGLLNYPVKGLAHWSPTS